MLSSTAMDELLLEVIPTWQWMAFAALFGAMWGSFANVVIVRWPEGLSVVRPASRCFSCETPINFYDNIPIFSYFILRGRCRSCKAKFSPRYMVVELAMALLSVGVLNMTLLNAPPSFVYGLAEYFIWFAFVWALVTAAIIDLETFLLPDVITLSGVTVGILVSVFVFKDDFLDHVIGALGAYGFLSLFFVHGYKFLTGKEGMGAGDPKLLAMIGAFFGVHGAIFTLFAGAIQGLVIGSILVIYRRRTGSGPEVPVLDEDDENDEPDDSRFRKAKVPFGPFLALGALEYYFFGSALMDWYLGGVTDLIGLF